MRNDEIYYVALDESGAATEVVLAEGNFLALQADLPERFASTEFKKIEHAKPTLDANQHAEYMQVGPRRKTALFPAIGM